MKALHTFAAFIDKGNSDKIVSIFYQSRNKIDMKTMKDYHNLYLKCDDLLLADVFDSW